MGASGVKPMAGRCVAGEISVGGHGVAVQGHVPVYRKQTQGRGAGSQTHNGIDWELGPQLSDCDC